jgi:hypothetical protein
VNDRPIRDGHFASLEPHIPALMNLLHWYPDVNDRGQRVTVVDHEPMACEICGDPAVVDAQWYAASGTRGWSRVCCEPCGTRRGTIDAATHLMWLTPAGDVRARQGVVRAGQAGDWGLRSPAVPTCEWCRSRPAVTCRPLALLETLDEYAVVLCGPCARDAHVVVSDVAHTDVPDISDEAGDRAEPAALASDLDVVVQAAIDAGWTPERRDGPSVAMSRDQVVGWDVVLADFDTAAGLRGAIHDRNVPGEPRTFDHTRSRAQVLSWLAGTAAAQAVPDGDRPSCRGCGTTVLAAVTVHPTAGAYLVEDQVRGLRQWLTAWCDGCAEHQLGDEPGWLVPEGADTATWPALAADTMAARLWDEVGVCFRRHDRISSEGSRRRYPRVAAMLRRLSCGLRFRATTTARKATEVDR